MAEFREDTQIYPLLIQLAACLCNELAASGLPEPCFCGIIPAGASAPDCGDCDSTGCGGSAWVQMVSAYPSVQFPSPAVDATCATLFAYDIEVGVSRCLKVMDARGNGPTVADQVAATRLQMADMAAIKRAVACCFAGQYADIDYLITPYQAIDAGGCAGGFFPITVRQAF